MEQVSSYGVSQNRGLWTPVSGGSSSSNKTTAKVHPGEGGGSGGGKLLAEEQPPQTAATWSDSSCYNYKPSALRWWFLTILVLCLAGLFGLTEYSIRHLPNFQDDRLSVLAGLAKQQIFNREDGRPPPLSPIRRAVSNSTATTAATTAATITATPGRDPYLHPGRQTTVTETRATSWPPMPTIEISFSTSTAQPLTAYNGTRTIAATTFFSTAASAPYLRPGQITSLCFTCSTSTTNPSGFLSPGRVMTTVGVPTTVDGTPTTVQRALPASPTAETTVLVRTETIPAGTTTLSSTVVDAAGVTSTVAIPTTYPESVMTLSTTVTIPPGMTLEEVATVVPTTIGGTPTEETTVFTDFRGARTTSTFLTTTGGVATVVRTTSTKLVPLQTPPATGVTDANNAVVVVMGVTDAQYVSGAFLPTILAVLMFQPLRLIDVNAKLFQPFHALARLGAGAPPEASIFLRFNGRAGLLSFPRAFRLGQPVLMLSQLVMLLAALLVPIAAESVAVHVPPGCTGGCYGTLGVSTVPVRVLEGLMVAIGILLLALLFLLGGRRWVTGVRHNPWSIAGMACLGLDHGIRNLLRTLPAGVGRKVPAHEMLAVLGGGGRLYALRPIPSPWQDDDDGYGLVISAMDRKNAVQPMAKTAAAAAPSGHVVAENDFQLRGGGGGSARKKIPVTSFSMLSWWGRALLLCLLLAVAALLLYYENSSGDTAFERFMDSQGFGVRFVFTLVGVMMGVAMTSFFRSVAAASPYLALSSARGSGRPAPRSILVSPPTNPFSGLRAALRQRNNPYLGFLAAATVLADVCLPVTLSHVPFSLVETFDTQLVCAWLSFAVIVCAAAAVAASFFIRWPHMPVDPRTVAGALYYVCDSHMLDTALDGMARATKRERNRVLALARPDARYAFGEMTGTSGKPRIGVDEVPT